MVAIWFFVYQCVGAESAEFERNRTKLKLCYNLILTCVLVTGFLIGNIFLNI